MDPSEIQADKDNDPSALEGTSTVKTDRPEPETKAAESDERTNTSGADIDATSELAGSTAPIPQPAKQSFMRRLWQKFNIYLLLLMLVILVAVGVSVALFLKSRADMQRDAIRTQDLSDSALKQLANTDVTVGNAKQILKVESNSIFAGSILVRSDLEVAGTIKAGGDLQLPGIAVSGESRFNQLQAETIAISSNATIQGILTARRGISVSGNSTFDGALSATQISTNALQLNGDLRLTHHIAAGGPVPGITRGTALGSGGTASLSGSDTTGSLTFNTGSGPGAGCFATVSFARKFDSVPHVTVTPVGSGAAGINYYVNRSTTEFSVCTTNTAPAGQTFGFDYIILN